MAGIEYVQAEDVRRSPFRVAITPLPSLNSALRDSVGPPRSGTPATWRAAVRRHLGPGDYETLAPFITPGKTLIPDPLLGLEDPPGEPFQRGIDRMLATPHDVLAEEISICRAATDTRVWDHVERDPQRWLRRYAASMLRAWKVFAPIWRLARPALERERERIAMATALDAQLELLEGLLPDAALHDDHWRIPCAFHAGRVHFPHNGLVLMPMLAGERSSVIAQARTVVHTVAYPLRPPPGPRPDRPAAPQLEALLGAPRARILRAAGTPTSITALAELLRAVPSAATHHVAALEAAGLVTRDRRGRNVLVRRTARGEALLTLYDDARAN